MKVVTGSTTAHDDRVRAGARGDAALTSPDVGGGNAELVSGLTSVVIVSYRSLATLPRCVQAVLSSSVPVELIVVDNASDDGSIDWLHACAEAERRLRVLANVDNRGFSAACNQGLAAVRGDSVLLLNPDAFLAVDSIERMRGLLARRPDIGLLGCRIDDERGRAHGPQRRREPTAHRSLMTLLGLDRWQRRWPTLAGIEMPAPSPARSIELVDAVNGSVMLVRTCLFRQLGGMDERFVLHAEDLDLCRRVRDAGWQVARAAEIGVVHLGGVSSRSRPFWVEWQKTRSLWIYFRKHEAAAPWHSRIAVATGLILRLGVKLPMLSLRCLRRGD